MENQESSIDYIVVINDEEQYSIWPVKKELPAGWKQVEEPGSKQVCLDYIEQVWTDMRPRSLREAMERTADKVAS